MKRINVLLPDELRVALKKRAVDEDTSYAKIVIKLIEQYLGVQPSND